MKIIKGADRSEVHWTARKLIELLEDGTVDFDIDIQRGYVWKKNDRKSEFIRTLILDNPVPPLYFNKIEEKYEGVDGKQRTLTLEKFLKDEFALSDLDIFLVENDGGVEEIDINGCKFSQLPETFKNAIRDYNFTICFKDNASQDEMADMFYSLNNGQNLSSATMNRVKAKSKKQFYRLGKHKLFTDSLSNVALEGHVNEDMVARAHAILNSDEVSTNMKWIRPYMREVDITDYDETLLIRVFDRIYKMHSLIDDKKIAKRIYSKTHMISIVPIVAQSIADGYSDNQMMEWFVNFFDGKKSPTSCKAYNDAAGRGTGNNSTIKKRLEQISKNYGTYFKNMKDVTNIEDDKSLDVA